MKPQKIVDNWAFQQEIHKWFASLTKEEKIQRLKDIGILDENGKLSKRYGG